MIRRAARRFARALAPGLSARDASHYYTFLGDDIVELRGAAQVRENKPLWLNVGLWEAHDTYPAAAAALATRLGERAELERATSLLDVGFGFAEQDLLWLERYPQLQITGYNVTPLHVETARARIAARGWEGRARMELGSATALPEPDAHFDRVTALECAFHFQTRVDFFREALRVLKPGGLLALTDMIPRPGDTSPPTLLHRFTWHRVHAPPVNHYDATTYQAHLRAAGFVDVEVQDLTAVTYPYYERYVAHRLLGRSMEEIHIAPPSRPLRVLDHLGKFGQYVLVRARRPHT